MARLPNQPMIAVARGGPATQAKEMIARVSTTSDGAAPECLRWANSRVLPTPAGPPSTTSPTTTIGSEVAPASTPARATVSRPQTSMGRR
jgi:hypothetical protein